MVLILMERHINKISLFCALIIIFSFSMFGCAAWEESIAQYGDDQMYDWIALEKNKDREDIKFFYDYLGKTKDEIVKVFGETNKVYFHKSAMFDIKCGVSDCSNRLNDVEQWAYYKFPQGKPKIRGAVFFYFRDGGVFSVEVGRYSLIDGKQWEGISSGSEYVDVVK